MKKWLVRIPMYADALVEVEAENEAAAIERGWETHHPTICHHCAQHIEISEFDVSADATAEEVEE
jgi:hypothetical protein